MKLIDRVASSTTCPCHSVSSKTICSHLEGVSMSSVGRNTDYAFEVVAG